MSAKAKKKPDANRYTVRIHAKTRQAIDRLPRAQRRKLPDKVRSLIVKHLNNI